MRYNLDIKRIIGEYNEKIAVLGSTGSIGTQTLEVARTNGDLTSLLWQRE